MDYLLGAGREHRLDQVVQLYILFVSACGHMCDIYKTALSLTYLPPSPFFCCAPSPLLFRLFLVFGFATGSFPTDKTYAATRGRRRRRR